MSERSVRSGGRLLIVGTPIGNLGDLSPRAAEALATADVIACEDTRRTGRLLQLSGIEKRPLLVCNEHTEVRAFGEVASRVAAGETVALVSDAGMPGISDPGERLVASLLERGAPIEVVPGPTAAVSALVLSGLATDRFVFEGFLPRKGGERTGRLAEIAAERRTVVCYESPKRAAKTLADLVAVCGPERRVAVGRELTKLHEEVVRGSLGEVAVLLADRELKGEVVLVIEGAVADERAWDDERISARLAELIEGGSSTRDAVAQVVTESGAAKRHVYDLATR
ncbi:MAG: 16S rRNA (cytidine(1402)-2'-O)-methyltransferase [Acidimicrobiales bacterium]